MRCQNCVFSVVLYSNFLIPPMKNYRFTKCMHVTLGRVYRKPLFTNPDARIPITIASFYFFANCYI